MERLRPWALKADGLSSNLGITLGKFLNLSMPVSSSVKQNGESDITQSDRVGTSRGQSLH